MSFSLDTIKELREKTGAGMMDCKKALTESGGDIEEALLWLRKKGQIVAEKKSSRETKEGAVGIFTAADGSKTAMLQLNCETDFVSRNENFTSLLNQLGEYLLLSDGNDFLQFKSPNGTVSEILTDAITSLGENLVVPNYCLYTHTPSSVIGSYVHTNGRIGCFVDVDSSVGAKPEIEALAKDLSMQIAAFPVQAIDIESIPQEILEKERTFLIDQAKESGKPLEIIEKMIDGRIQKFKKEIALLEQPFLKNPDHTVKQHIAAVAKESGAGLKITDFKKFSL